MKLNQADFGLLLYPEKSSGAAASLITRLEGGHQLPTIKEMAKLEALLKLSKGSLTEGNEESEPPPSIPSHSPASQHADVATVIIFRLTICQYLIFCHRK